MTPPITSEKGTRADVADELTAADFAARADAILTAATAPRWRSRTELDALVGMRTPHRAPTVRPTSYYLGAQRAARRRAKRGGAPDNSVRFYLTDHQYEVHTAEQRHRVLIAGRRFGKTYLACIELIDAALSRAGALCWYVAPTYRMAKDIAWETLRTLIDPSWLAGPLNESSLSVRFRNGSRIQLKGAENPDRLRGRELYFVVVDEFTMCARKLWTEALRPSLSRQKGRALFIGTPMGYNWSYDLYLRGIGLGGRAPAPLVRLDGSYRPAPWRSFQFTTLDGGWITPEEVADARNEMDERTFRQEYEASFEALTGRVYDKFDRLLNCKSDIADHGAAVGAINRSNPGLEPLPVAPLYVGMDFNVNPMTCVVALRVGDQCHVLDAIELPSSNTDEMASELKRRYPGRTLIVCPDASGSARHTSSSAADTDHTILRRAGFKVSVAPANPRVSDRINAVQAMLCAADGTRRLFLHPVRAVALVKALDGLTYKDATSEPDKKSPYIHIGDALGYMIWQEFNLLDSRKWRFAHNPR